MPAFQVPAAGRLVCVTAVTAIAGMGAYQGQNDPDEDLGKGARMVTKAKSPHAVERRKFSRKDVMWVATLATSSAEADCVVLNISKNGAMICLVDTFEAAASTILSVPSFIVMDRGNDIRCDTMWRNDDLLGVQFQDS